MILQEFKHGCGAAAVVNALEALGHKTSQNVIAKLARLGPDGTDEKDLKRALGALGFDTPDVLGRTFDSAISHLRGHLLSGHPVVLSVDNADHWVVAIGLLGTGIVVADSALSEVVVVIPEYMMCNRWEERDGKNPWYGFAVIPCVDD